jgi:hypothetical protein
MARRSLQRYFQMQLTHSQLRETAPRVVAPPCSNGANWVSQKRRQAQLQGMTHENQQRSRNGGGFETLPRHICSAASTAHGCTGVVSSVELAGTRQSHLRQTLLQQLRAALTQRSAAQVFLLYSPGADDPLGLRDLAASPDADLAADGAPPAKPHTRTVARMPWAGMPEAHQSRVIELDCRKVAAYLLESHPGLDDPLLEESFTLAASYLDGQPEAETSEPRGRHVAGWLVSTDPASAIARRLANADAPLDTRAAAGYGVAWHDPRVVGGLWASLNAAQRLALLGPHTTWIAVDAPGQIVQWSASASDGTADARTATTAKQKAHLLDEPAVLSLLEAWRSQCAEQGRTLPANAQERLHGHVAQARGAGLDGEDLQVYALWATRLHPGFEAELPVRHALAQAAQNPDTLGQLLPAALAGPLLARYAIEPPAAAKAFPT